MIAFLRRFLKQAFGFFLDLGEFAEDLPDFSGGSGHSVGDEGISLF
jgi:hypothetical protein